MTVINMLKGEGNWTGCYGAVVIETKTLHSNMMEWRVLHVSCWGNSISHILAKLASSLNHAHLWFENFLVCINEYALANQASS
jgi:hypothetical protein